ERLPAPVARVVAGPSLIAVAVVAGQSRHEFLLVPGLDVLQELGSTATAERRGQTPVMTDDDIAPAYDVREAFRSGRGQLGSAADPPPPPVCAAHRLQLSGRCRWDSRRARVPASRRRWSPVPRTASDPRTPRATAQRSLRRPRGARG